MNISNLAMILFVVIYDFVPFSGVWENCIIVETKKSIGTLNSCKTNILELSSEWESWSMIKFHSVF